METDSKYTYKIPYHKEFMNIFSKIPGESILRKLSVADRTKKMRGLADAAKRRKSDHPRVSVLFYAPESVQHCHGRYFSPSSPFPRFRVWSD